MSADNWLYLTKTKQGYQISERWDDGMRAFNIKCYPTLRAALVAVKKLMDEAEPGDYEYGLRLGKI